MKICVQRLKNLSSQKALLNPCELKNESIKIVSDYLYTENLDFNSNFSLKGLTFPGVQAHACFDILNLDSIKLIAIATHSKKLKFGGFYLDLPLLDLNNSVGFHQPGGLSRSDFIYDCRPGRFSYSLINEDRLIPKAPKNAIESLGLINDYEKLKMSSNLKMSLHLDVLSRELCDPISMPYQVNRNRISKMIEFSDNEKLKNLSKSLYYKVLEYNDKIALYDSEVGNIDRIKFIKFVEIVLNKVDYGILVQGGYWDSHVNSNDFEWINTLDFI
jgi:hypothetical protein